MEKYQFTFCKFQSKEDLSPFDFLKKIISKKYVDDTEWGFSNSGMQDNVVTSILLKKEKAYYKIWNPDERILEKRIYTMVREIPIIVDFSHHLITVEGGSRALNSLKQVLRNIYYGYFVYTPTTQSPYDYIKVFLEDHAISSVKELTLADFCYDERYRGRFVAKILTPFTNIRELDEVKNNIVNSKLVLNFRDGEIEFSSAINGSIVLSCHEDYKQQFIEYLSKKMY